MPSAGSIFVDLLLNDASFADGAKRSSKALKEFGDVASKATKLAAGAIAAAGAAITALTIKQLNAIDSTVKLSRSLGIANESFQALARVADEAGVDQDALTALITKSQKAIVDASRATDQSSNAFKRLGLNTKELLELEPDQQFQKIEEALAKIENPTLRTATALEIFGKQGRIAANVSEDLSAKINEAREFNDKFGISVSNIDARKVEEANDTFARLGSALGGIGNIIAVQVAPLITAMSQALLDSGIDGQTAGNAIKSALEGAGAVIDIVRKGVLGLRAIFVRAAQGILELGVKFQEASVAIAEFQDSIFSTDSNTAGLKQARASLEDARNLAGGAADEYARLEAEAANFETTSQKVAKIQDEASSRAIQAEQKLKASRSVTLPIEDGNSEAAKKKLDTIKQINAELTKEIESTGIEVSLFGQGKDILDRQLKQNEILLRLKEQGVNLSEADRLSLEKKLDILEANKKRLEDLEKAKSIIDDSRTALDKYNQTHAELNRLQQEGFLSQTQFNSALEKARDTFAENDEETKKMNESVKDLGLTFNSAFEDAISGGKSFRDILKGVESDLIKLGTREFLTKPFTSFFDSLFKPSPGEGGGGFGSIFSSIGGLFGFASGGSFQVGGTGGVDSQLVAFKASPWERVSVTNPGQRDSGGGSQVIFNVSTPDANSFQRSQGQIMARAQAQLQRSSLRNA